MEKLTITSIDRRDREGAKGPYESLWFTCQEHGAKKISGFGKAGVTDSWTVGTVVEVEVSETQKDGKTYTNFKLPQSQKAGGQFSASASELKNMLTFKVIPALEIIAKDVAWLKQQEMTRTQDKGLEEIDFGEPEEPTF